MYRLISHCHTYHSFDSHLNISDVVSECLANSINAIILNDHDVFLLRDDELNSFYIHDITVYKAVEFTTSEGVHIIGIHENIIKLVKEPFFYTAFELINALRDLQSVIILPHPTHNTGVLGNKKIKVEDSLMVIESADAFEVDNYRYGPTKQNDIDFLTSKNPSLCSLIGSDAHVRSEVSAFINIFNSSERDLKILLNTQPQLLRLKKRNVIYFYKRKVKKSRVYQFIINIFTPKFRRKIKDYLRL